MPPLKKKKRTIFNCFFVSFLITFASQAEGGVLHPSISKCMRNGRLSYPEQVVPRDCELRHLFCASPGHRLLSVDYNYIELCTLAAICEHEYQYSILARVIRANIDPHSFTASQLVGMPLESFCALKTSGNSGDREKYAQHRAIAKKVNFATASGQTRIVVPDVKVEQAKAFRLKLITSIYPELKIILRDDTIMSLATNLHCNPEAVKVNLSYHGRWNRDTVSEIADVVCGNRCSSRHGYPLSKKWKKQVWDGLALINRNGALSEAISSRAGSPTLHSVLFGKFACTLTGRVRARTTYTSALNTVFSGLAADGAKLAMWNLTHIGYRVVGFIHDEIVVEVPEEADLQHEAALVQQVMEESMASVAPTIPIRSTADVADRRCLDPKKCFSDVGTLLPFMPQEMCPQRIEME
eukprot:TRINITY_DN11888_c0_g1_i2.p1 TRINITY_DN11888_c0_g1~~TRINITY_DN11888_c0_g1_i2.p1  ORF type:complete len:410 (-),score=72.85 TRINITY_DN11888_c0_g1_i2:80-1309(-)